MKFYFYVNKNIMFDFLGLNLIAPNAVVNDIKGYRTISTAADSFLFVTHLKLDRKTRERGIAQPEFVYPVTLEISDISSGDGMAVLVEKTDDGYEYSYESVCRYNPEIHIGACLIGEIPLSRVEKIYFDTEEDELAFSRPSPDYWYPVHKFAILTDDFNTALEFIPEEERISGTLSEKTEEIVASIKKRERLRAGILNFFNGTKNWQYGKYEFNVDSSLQNMLEISDDELSSVITHYKEARAEGKHEEIELLGRNENIGKNYNQLVYDSIRDVFLSRVHNVRMTPDKIPQLLDNIEGKIVSFLDKPDEIKMIHMVMSEIKNMISGSSDKNPEDICRLIPDAVDVLKALTFTVKNPDKYEVFLEGLQVYHADVITKRRAAVLWGFLNGLYGVPGSGFNKDNEKLWQFAEAYSQGLCQNCRITLMAEMPDNIFDGKSILGIELKEKRIVTAAEARDRLLAMPPGKHGRAFYNKLFDAAQKDCGSKKKAENKGYVYYAASVCLPEIKAGDRLDKNTKKLLETLLKDCRNSVPDKEKLFHDYIENENKFEEIFRLDPEFWIREAFC